MLPSPGNPEFGESRKIDGKTYELESTFTRGSNKARAKAWAKSIRSDYDSVRVLTNAYGSCAVYVYKKVNHD